MTDLTAFLAALQKTDEVELTVTGRKTGEAHTFPVWFVLEGQTLYLLPIYGASSPWYQNVAANGQLLLRLRGQALSVKPLLLTDKTRVAQVVDQFRQRYGAGDVARYYKNFDAAIQVDLSE